MKVTTREGYAVSVVMASQGYPGKYTNGRPIELKKAPSGMFFSLLIVFLGFTGEKMWSSSMQEQQKLGIMSLHRVVASWLPQLMHRLWKKLSRQPTRVLILLFSKARHTDGILAIGGCDSIIITNHPTA